MNKTILSLLLALPLTAYGSGQIISENFEGGIPSSFRCIDNDGNTPSADTRPLGFDKGVAWTTYYLAEEKNHVACSTSWYSPAGTSDDWMILPPLKIENDLAILKWRAKASDSSLSDGYAVYISTDGAEIGDFKSLDPSFQTAAESAEWTDHQLSLAQYAGKTVNIAFVNTAHDCAFLYLDDIFAGSPLTISLRPGMKTIAKPGEELPLSVLVTTALDEPIKGFKLQGSVGDESFTIDCSDNTLVKGQEISIDLGKTLKMEAGENLPFDLHAEAAGKSFDKKFDLRCACNIRVAEEFTGTWCAWCVRGIATIKKMQEKYPDSFIAIALHCGDRDPMHETNCIKGIPTWGFDGYPYCIMNRRKDLNGDPSNMEQWYQAMENEDVKATLSASATRQGDNITISTDVWFANDESNANYALAYTVIENDVHGDSARYNQDNAYAGGSRGEMGGFESLPSVIPYTQMWYQEVARHSFDSATGVEGSIPPVLEAGVPVSFDYTYTMPENVLVPENTECVVLLLNTLNDHIITAAKVSTGDTLGIDGVGSDKADVVETGRYNIQGFAVDAGYRGLVIIRLSDGTARKVMQ